MKLKELSQIPELKFIVKGKNLEEEITGGYCGDLLSWVMSHAQKGNIWITVQTHINIIAIASLLELSAIIIPENIEIEEETKEKAIQEGITVIRSSLPTFEIVKILSERGI